MSVDVYFLFEYYVVSYFENIPSLQSSANGLTVAHVSVSIFKKIKTRAMKLVSKKTPVIQTIGENSYS